ncbi:hypothetical protein GCM10023187_08820 [Nibrella viscosa]|uniref:Peptide methionine sulfoxide reductase MsrA n=1 Tax=Nibrella viscosa TaxID=1084524 RepID=A0ABP8JZ35_9BACT
MNRLLSTLLSLLLLTGCAQQQSSTRKTTGDQAPARLPTLQPGEAVATFAGGCFWCLEEEFEELKGVREVISGYAGGRTENPTYEQVGTDTTGHAEAVQVYYNPAVISYDTLVKAFFSGHDPTTLNRQGPDIGEQYRSVAFYRTLEEKASIEVAIRAVNASGHFSDPVVTEIVPFRIFYPAEVYHQGYYRQHPENPYIQRVSMPKVAKFRKAMQGKLKDDIPAM